MPSSTDPAPVRVPTANNAVLLAALAAVADAILILAFAAIGRDAHQRGDVITGVLSTAWPFLTGAAIAWLAVRVWQRPLRIWPEGVAVWLGAVALGMALRAVTGQTVVLPFIIVATLSLGVFLVGYRLIVAAAGRLKGRRQLR
ncbi:DUF3054 domain-containing protein [Arthrobacter sp. NPDC058288]|uniref:DUF3054 domain-containing protein n=1 Tax=Arthrobacter sp. NPDC058288 TaxID=3346424 RepID=UPI0036E6EDC9